MSLTYKKFKSQEDIDKYLECDKKVYPNSKPNNKVDYKDFMYTIYSDGKAIGYIGLCDMNYRKKKYLGICNFIIEPKLQGKGYGTKVIKDIIEIHKKRVDTIFCWVDEDNKDAIKFYKKFTTITEENLRDGQYYVLFYDKNDKPE